MKKYFFYTLTEMSLADKNSGINFLSKLALTLVILMSLFIETGFSQINIHQANVFVHPSAQLSIKGNLEGETSILGTGKVIFSGTSIQQVYLPGFRLPEVELNNLSGVQLLGDVGFTGDLTFTSGKWHTGAFQLYVNDSSQFIGQTNSNYIVTGLNGRVVKEISQNLQEVTIPVGTETGYFPIKLSSIATYNNAQVSVQCVGNTHPAKHPASTEFIGQYWSLTQTGLTGTLYAKGQYGTGGNISGQENLLHGLFFTGSDWQSNGTTIDFTNHEAGATIQGNGDLYAMNKFVLVKAKAFIQSAYQTGQPYMKDLLRNSGNYVPGTMPASNLIPVADPYRSTTLQQHFTHINNPVAETIAPQVLYDQADAARNIVDWVFLELRKDSTSGPGTAILQTRSALLRRDGMITDMDGLSPVYFRGIDAGNAFTLVVRHRNHLGMATNPSSFLQQYSLSNSSNLTDFSSLTETQVYGPLSSCAQYGAVNVLWAGNVNADSQIRYNGPGNDRDYLLSTFLQGAAGTILTDVYSEADINMNRIVRYNGPSNDRDYLLSTPLESNQGTIRTQYLPN